MISDQLGSTFGCGFPNAIRFPTGFSFGKSRWANGLIDHHSERGVAVVLWSKRAALQHRNVHRAEVVRTDTPEIERLPLVDGDNRASFNPETELSVQASAATH